MFTNEEKLKAINLYKQTGSKAVTQRMLGYPKNRHSLDDWLKDYEMNGCFTNIYNRLERNYTKDEIEYACEYYQECLSIKQTIDDLGFPETRMTLWRWLKNNGIILTKKRENHIYTDEEKKNIIIENLIIGIFKM